MKAGRKGLDPKWVNSTGNPNPDVWKDALGIGGGGGGGNVDDVTVNGVSVVSEKTANISIPVNGELTLSNIRVTQIKATTTELEHSGTIPGGADLVQADVTLFGVASTESNPVIRVKYAVNGGSYSGIMSIPATTGESELRLTLTRVSKDYYIVALTTGVGESKFLRAGRILGAGANGISSLKVDVAAARCTFNSGFSGTEMSYYK